MCFLSKAHVYLGLDSLKDVVCATVKGIAGMSGSEKAQKPKLLQELRRCRRGSACLIDALSVRALRRRVI